MDRKPRNLIGPQLRKLRSQQGYTQIEFAEHCQRLGWDLSRDTYARIEGQTRWVSDFEMFFLSNALKVSLEDLLPGNNRRHQVLKQLINDLETRVK